MAGASIIPRSGSRVEIDPAQVGACHQPGGSILGQPPVDVARAGSQFHLRRAAWASYFHSPADDWKHLAPAQGAVFQEVLDLATILNALRAR